ncbi:hypothetical protein ACVWXM_004078 [Bradyrhizobium sp. GM7.3]
MTGNTALMRNPSHKGLPPAPDVQPDDRSTSERRAADAEMARVLRTEPFRMALDSSGAGIAHWKHDALHDVVEPMRHHVIMAHKGVMQRMERRSGKSIAIGTFRPGVVNIVPEGSSSRWDIPKPVDVVQLYLPDATLQRVAGEAGTAGTAELIERTAHPDTITSRLLLSAADSLGGHGVLDALFRHQLTDLLATRLLAAHAPRSSRPWAGWRRRSCSVRSNDCAAIAKRMSRSMRWRPMPDCRASISAGPSRRAPGYRRMPGCVSTGSSRP